MEFPCLNCITLPLCRNRFGDPGETFITKAINVISAMEFCCLINAYLNLDDLEVSKKGKNGKIGRVMKENRHVEFIRYIGNVDG